MVKISPEDRSVERRLLDEAIAAEAQTPIPEIDPTLIPVPVEVLLQRSAKPVAISGVVENGLIRLLDPSIRLPERSKVIIVANERN